MRRFVVVFAAFCLVSSPVASAAGSTLDVAPKNLNFGRQAFGSTTTGTITITNRTGQALVVSIDEVSIPDSITPGQTESTCPLGATTLGAGESCTQVVAFFADPYPAFAGRQSGELLITARDEGGNVVYSRIVKITARGFESLASLVAAGDRDAIRAWAAARTVAQIDSEVAALTAAERDQLAAVILDTNATGESRDKMLRVIRAVLAVPELGFYTEIWSYTFIELTGDGFFGTCNHVFLSPDAWGGLSDQDARAVLMHESFHSFNCVNGGPAGALNEGSAIWITNAPFTSPLLPGQSFAEATYGTKLYYRDIVGDPNYPLEAAQYPSQKLIDVYTYMSTHDPSKLPWNSNDRLVTCFNRYFVDLDRNVDFYNVWLPAVKERTDLMLADPECQPV
jgi:hypothetical protein